MVDLQSVAVDVPTADQLASPPPTQGDLAPQTAATAESIRDTLVISKPEPSPPPSADLPESTTTKEVITNSTVEGNATRNKKKKSSSYRRRQRKSTQKQEASFTRLAAMLGQIKEACTGTDILNKVGPLVEAATSIIETLSMKATANSPPPAAVLCEQVPPPQKAPSEGTENTLPTSAAASPTKFTGMMHHQWKNNTGMVVTTPSTTVRPGQRIPPHVYLGTRAPGIRAMMPTSAAGPNNRLPLSPMRMAPTKMLSDKVQQQMARENALAELRGKLRAATCKADCEALIRELEVHQAEYELSAARTRLSQFAH